MNCAYKFRIYPNKKQEKQIAQSLGCARFIFNRILELSEKYYKRTGKHLSKYTWNNYCNRIIKKQYPFLKEVDKFLITNSIYDLIDRVLYEYGENVDEFINEAFTMNLFKN